VHHQPLINEKNVKHQKNVPEDHFEHESHVQPLEHENHTSMPKLSQHQRCKRRRTADPNDARKRDNQRRMARRQRARKARQTLVEQGVEIDMMESEANDESHSQLEMINAQVVDAMARDYDLVNPIHDDSPLEDNPLEDMEFEDMLRQWATWVQSKEAQDEEDTPQVSQAVAVPKKSLYEDMAREVQGRWLDAFEALTTPSA